MDRLFLAVDATAARTEARRTRQESRQGGAVWGAVSRGSTGGSVRGSRPGAKASSFKTGDPVAGLADKRHAFSRAEFTSALVQVSVCRYVLPGEIADCSEALQRLIEVDILSHMPRHTTFAPPDYFRRRHLYIDSTSATLRRHEATLRTLFSAVALVKPTPKPASTAESKLLLSFRGWLAFLQAVRLIDVDLSEREASLAWAWSRTAVVDETTAWGHVQATHVPFTGFCEALCRVATLKALPTDEEVALQFSNAHQYLRFHEQNNHEK